MSWKHYLTLTFISLVLVMILAGFQSAPGYMDAEYYYSMALRIVNREGFAEPFIWNYLSGVESLPHPGFTYWMPLPALVSSLGIWVTGLKTFAGAKIFHLILSALIPALTMKLAWELTRSRPESFLAGLFAAVPVFYNVFLGTTDSFAVTMLLGGTFFLLLMTRKSLFIFLGLGAISGLMHLTRADGLIWLLGGVYFALRVDKRKLTALILVAAGYLIFMGPWFFRNMVIFEQIMPSGTSKAFWLKEYNDLFSYSAASLNYQNWVSQGLPKILGNVVQAGLANLKTALLVQGQVVLAPFIWIGAWKFRDEKALQATTMVWFAIFVLMTCIFPFAGMRGGFLHSGAAFQPLLWVLASCGFFRCIEWGVEKREWVKSRSGTVFGGALVVMLVAASLFVFQSRVIGGDLSQPIWNRSHMEAIAIDKYLTSLGVMKSEPVLINNPPGLYAAAYRTSVTIPNEGLEAIFEIGKEFGVHYLVLEENHPAALADLYLNPERSSKLEYVGEVDRALIYRLPHSGEIDD